MGWLITCGVLALLAVLPLGVGVRYDENGPLVRLVLGPVKLTVFPRPKKQKKEAKGKKGKSETGAQDAAQAQTAAADPEPKLPEPPKKPKQKDPETKGGSLLDFLPLVKLALNFLGDFRRKLRVNDLYVKLILAGDDPCDLAVNYGRAWAAVGNLMPKLERWFVMKKQDVEVECDFTASQTLIVARLELTVTLGRIIGLLAVYALRAVKEYLSIRKKRKGGAVT